MLERVLKRRSLSLDSDVWMTWPPYWATSGTTLSRVASRTSTMTAALPRSRPWPRFFMKSSSTP